MKAISKPGDNLGGLTKVWAIPSDVYNLNGEDISISDETNVYSMYCSTNDLSFDEPRKESDAGIFYEPTVNGFVPGNDKDRLEAFEYIERRKWVILFKDGNGNYLAAGTREQPLHLTSQFSSGKDTVGRNGYSFAFTGKCTVRSKFVNNPF